MRAAKSTLLVFLVLAADVSIHGQTGGGFTGTVTNQAYASANSRFLLSIAEGVPTAARSGAYKMVATMDRVEDGKQISIWKASFTAQPTRYWLKSEIFVSDSGKFALIPHERSQWTLLNDGKAVRLPEVLGGSARQPGEKILEVDDNQSPVIRIWNRETEEWSAYSVRNQNPIPANPERVREWNESTRQNILRRMRQMEAEQLRKKLSGISEKLSDVAKAAMSYSPPKDIRETFLEFLALQRNPEDRIWFEKLLRGEFVPLASPFSAFLTGGMRHHTSDPYHYVETNDRMLFGDALLAMFEKKLTQKLSYGKRPEKPYYLGKVSGSVRLPAPILNNAGFIRIHLVPHERIHKNWIDLQKVSLEEQLLMTTHRQFDLSDEISFSFETAPPGKYMVKAIWDKRRPFSNRDGAGPGDYQSDWVGPIEIKAGGEVTDLFIDCDQRTNGGEEYYAADRVAVRKWKKTGELTLLSHAPKADTRKEIFSAPISSCIVRTNYIKAGKAVEFTRIAIFAHSSTNQPSPPLTILWRHGVTANGRPARLPMQICILDQHGCQFAPDQITTTARAEIANFPFLPRAEATWRLVGYGPTGEDDLLFDYTIKNPALREAASLTPQTFPSVIDLRSGFETFQMQVTRAVVSPKSVRLEATFSENGIPASDWTIGDVIFSDANGEIDFPSDGCRQKTALRLTGHIHHKTDDAKAPIPFELIIPPI